MIVFELLLHEFDLLVDEISFFADVVQAEYTVHFLDKNIGGYYFELK